jgi:transposase-like protein
MDSQARRYITTDRPGQRIPAVPLAERRQNVRNLNLEDLRKRGLDTTQPTLLLLGGAKALHAATRRLWGQNAVIQQCQVHKKRNVQAHVSEKHQPELDLPRALPGG